MGLGDQMRFGSLTFKEPVPGPPKFSSRSHHVGFYTFRDIARYLGTSVSISMWGC